MLIGTLWAWRNLRGILRYAKISPDTARSIASERINIPSKTVDKIESAPLIAISTFVEGPKYTPPNRQIKGSSPFSASWQFQRMADAGSRVSENELHRKPGFREEPF